MKIFIINEIYYLKSIILCSFSLINRYAAHIKLASAIDIIIPSACIPQNTIKNIFDNTVVNPVKIQLIEKSIIFPSPRDIWRKFPDKTHTIMSNKIINLNGIFINNETIINKTLNIDKLSNNT